MFTDTLNIVFFMASFICSKAGGIPHTDSQRRANSSAVNSLYFTVNSFISYTFKIFKFDNCHFKQYEEMEKPWRKGMITLSMEEISRGI